MPIAEIVDNAVVLSAFGEPTRIANIDHLIAMKRAVGRPVDLSDVQGLEAIVKNAS